MKSKEFLLEKWENCLKDGISDELHISKEDVVVDVVDLLSMGGDHNFICVEIPINRILFPEIFTKFEGLKCVLIDALCASGVYRIMYSCQ